MTEISSTRFLCPICAAEKPRRTAVQGEMVHGPTFELIRKDHPAWTAAEVICRDCLNRYRAGYVESVLKQDRGELTNLEQEVVRSLREHEILSHNPDVEFDQSQTLGQRIADKVASFGGSWRFIIIFGSVLACWIGFNSLMLLRKPFDPFPFILLNLVLSCVAAIQAPVIMMSQNRQDAKDRMRGELDYEVNRRAESEIQALSGKLNQLADKLDDVEALLRERKG
jgi:uncharacterized membrane protein